VSTGHEDVTIAESFPEPAKYFMIREECPFHLSGKNSTVIVSQYQPKLPRYLAGGAKTSQDQLVSPRAADHWARIAAIRPKCVWLSKLEIVLLYNS